MPLGGRTHKGRRTRNSVLFGGYVACVPASPDIKSHGVGGLCHIIDQTEWAIIVCRFVDLTEVPPAALPEALDRFR